MAKSFHRYLTNLELVREWYSCVRPARFDAQFIDSLEEHLDRTGALSYHQERALENIIESWGIDTWADNNVD